MSHTTLVRTNNHRYRIKYAIIIDSVHFQSPYLIELSSRANTTIEDVSYFFSDNIIYPNEKMYHLLKILKHPSMFSNNIRDTILNKLVSIIESKEDTKFNQEKYLQLAIEIMIDEKVDEIYNVNQKKRFTRKDASNKNMILKRLKENRRKRLHSAYKYEFKVDYYETKNNIEHEIYNHYKL